MKTVIKNNAQDPCPPPLSFFQPHLIRVKSDARSALDVDKKCQRHKVYVCERYRTTPEEHPRRKGAIPAKICGPAGGGLHAFVPDRDGAPLSAEIVGQTVCKSAFADRATASCTGRCRTPRFG